MKRAWIVALLLAAAGLALYWFCVAFPARPYGGEATQEVKKGEGIASIVKELERVGLTDSPRKMDFYLRYVRRVGAKLVAGEYQFGPGATPSQIADKLIKGER